MKTSQPSTRLFAALLFASFSALSSRAQTVQLKVEPPLLNFAAHDIGTTSPLTLTVTNNGTVSANLAIALTGDDSAEFSWNSVCLSGLPPSGKCNVTVHFAPLKIAKEEKREAQLVISSEKGESQSLRLTGSAYQNLGVSPAHLGFGDQPVDKAASPRTIVVTNYSDATVSSIADPGGTCQFKSRNGRWSGFAGRPRASCAD